MGIRVLIIATTLALAAARVDAVEPPDTREADVRTRGADVMSFDLAKTLHHFDKTPTGGTQRVVARDGHIDQLPSIRAHLRDIAAAFTARDFGGPAHIHGDAMPGLSQLRSAASADLTIVYRDIDDGGEIVYSATTPDLRDAVHRWFDAQLSDHGHDATGHAHHAH